MTRKSSSVTIRDVASKAGVSVATVSRYINQPAVVSEPVAERISQVMRELSYVPHSIARQLATRKTNTIGLLLTNTNHDFFGPLLTGIEQGVSEKGYNLLVASFQAERDLNATPPIGAHNSDGLIVFANSLDNRRLYALYNAGFPTVLMHRTPPPDLPIPCVTIENKAATRKLIEHLITNHGKRRLLFLHGPQGQEDSHWREMGYRAALASNGIDFNPTLVFTGGFEREPAYDAMNKFLVNGHPEFDAVFAGDDAAAIGVIESLAEHGLRVPEDIAVVGFDDQRLSAFLNPPLTTVRAPTTEVGRTAARQLFNIIEEKPADPITLLPTEIIIRRSCGCEI